MERLTNNETIQMIFGCGRSGGKTYFAKVHSKLSKLEDIEEELGIPLEVLFKALKEGIVMDGEEYQTFLMYDEVTNSYCFKCGGWGKYFLKDYRKTWALTREELENAKD